MVLGEKKYDPKCKSRCFNQCVANIRETCKEDPPAMFTHLIENYKDEDYFSSDTDEKVDRLVAFAYIGNTAMQQSVPMGSRSGSGSSESSSRHHLHSWI